MLEMKEWETKASDTRELAFFSFGADMGVCMTSPSVVSLERNCSQTSDSEWLDSEVELARIIVGRFKDIPQVNSIFLRFQDDEFLVWTILESYDREARDKIYDRELELCDSLKLDDLDFRVTSKNLMAPDELQDAGYHNIFTRN